MEISYTLDKQHFVEYYTLLSQNDPKVKKSFVRLRNAINLLIALVILLIWKINTYSVLALILFSLVFVFVFPIIFYKVSQKRIKRIIEKTDLVFNEIRLTVTEKTIDVDEGNKQFQIDQSNFTNILSGKYIIIIFYDTKDSLIIPKTKLESNIDLLNNTIREISHEKK